MKKNKTLFLVNSILSAVLFIASAALTGIFVYVIVQVSLIYREGLAVPFMAVYKLRTLMEMIFYALPAVFGSIASFMLGVASQRCERNFNDPEKARKKLFITSFAIISLLFVYLIIIFGIIAVYGFNY